MIWMVLVIRLAKQATLPGLSCMGEPAVSAFADDHSSIMLPSATCFWCGAVRAVEKEGPAVGKGHDFSVTIASLLLQALISIDNTPVSIASPFVFEPLLPSKAHSNNSPPVFPTIITWPAAKHTWLRAL
jgi:hypothetical protein